MRFNKLMVAGALGVNNLLWYTEGNRLFSGLG